MQSQSEVHTKEFDLVTIQKKGNMMNKLFRLTRGKVHRYICIEVHVIGRWIVCRQQENVAMHIEDTAEYLDKQQQYFF